MAELEIHHEGHESDPHGKRVGLLAASLAVLLAVVTISSHRTHTEAIIEKSNSNDRWSQYQSSRLKFHNLELAETLITVLGQHNEAAAGTLEKNGKDKQKYEEQGKEIMALAREAEAKSEAAEHRALRFDIGEGMLEIGLVLSSLYFIARRRIFPMVGIVAGVAGVIIAVMGFLMH